MGAGSTLCLLASFCGCPQKSEDRRKGWQEEGKILSSKTVQTKAPSFLKGIVPFSAVASSPFSSNPTPLIFSEHRHLFFPGSSDLG